MSDRLSDVWSVEDFDRCVDKTPEARRSPSEADGVLPQRSLDLLALAEEYDVDSLSLTVEYGMIVIRAWTRVWPEALRSPVVAYGGSWSIAEWRASSGSHADLVRIVLAELDAHRHAARCEPRA